MPNVPARDYTAAIWFKGYATGTWANALEGIHPILTVRSGDQSAAAASSGGEGGLPPWALALAAGALLTAVGGWAWRRLGRRPIIGA
ncbi:MAG: hypothetical protein WD067_09150 [Gaiellaceae bacterium]